jgi:hypothetical protein
MAYAVIKISASARFNPGNALHLSANGFHLKNWARVNSYIQLRTFLVETSIAIFIVYSIWNVEKWDWT